MKLRYAQLALTGTLAVGWTPAYAYLDPGTGSALIQGLIAVIAAAGITAMMYWHQLKDFLGFNKNQNPEISSECPDEAENSSE